MRYLDLLIALRSELMSVLRVPVVPLHASVGMCYLPTRNRKRENIYELLKQVNAEIESTEVLTKPFDKKLQCLNFFSVRLEKSGYQNIEHFYQKIFKPALQRCKKANESGFVRYMQDRKRLTADPKEAHRSRNQNLVVSGQRQEQFDKVWTGQAHHQFMSKYSIFEGMIKSEWLDALPYARDIFEYYIFLRRFLYLTPEQAKHVRVFPYQNASVENLLQYNFYILTIIKHLHLHGLVSFAGHFQQQLKEKLAINLVNDEIKAATTSIYLPDYKHLVWEINACDDGLGATSCVNIKLVYSYQGYSNVNYSQDPLTGRDATGSLIEFDCPGSITVQFDLLMNQQELPQVVFPCLQVKGFDEAIRGVIENCWSQ